MDDAKKPPQVSSPPTSVHTHDLTEPNTEYVPPWEVEHSNSRCEETPYQQFRHGGWRQLRERCRSGMIEAGMTPKTIERYDKCGSCCQLFYSKSTGRKKIVGDFCKCRTCAPCSNAKARLISGNLIKFLGDRHTRFTTLTIVHRGETLTELIDRLVACFKLLRRRGAWKKYVAGFAAFMEAKWSTRTKGWHVHFHILTEGLYWPQKELSREWHICTGNSYIVDIQAKGTNASRAYYASKYASKPFNSADIPDAAKLTEAIKSLHRRKLWYVGGSWKSLRLLAKSVDTTTDWEHICSLTRLFNDARSGDAAAIALLSDLINVEIEDRGLPPPD